MCLTLQHVIIKLTLIKHGWGSKLPTDSQTDGFLWRPLRCQTDRRVGDIILKAIIDTVTSFQTVTAGRWELDQAADTANIKAVLVPVADMPTMTPFPVTNCHLIPYKRFSLSPSGFTTAKNSLLTSFLLVTRSTVLQLMNSHHVDDWAS